MYFDFRHLLLSLIDPTDNQNKTETEHKQFSIVRSKLSFKHKQIAHEYSFQLKVHGEIGSMTKNERENPDIDDTLC